MISASALLGDHRYQAFQFQFAGPSPESSAASSYCSGSHRLSQFALSQKVSVSNIEHDIYPEFDSSPSSVCLFFCQLLSLSLCCHKLYRCASIRKCMFLVFLICSVTFRRALHSRHARTTFFGYHEQPVRL